MKIKTENLILSANISEDADYTAHMHQAQNFLLIDELMYVCCVVHIFWDAGTQYKSFSFYFHAFIMSSHYFLFIHTLT